MNDLIGDFIAETREGLEALDSELVRFERNPGDPALLGGIFRLIHTIKGTCGFLGLGRLQSVAHAAENVLGAFRDGDLTATPLAVSAILDTVDLIRAMLDALAQDGVEPTGDDSALIGRLQALLVAPAAFPAAADRPLIDRLGGDAALDCACDMALGAERASGGDERAAQAELDRLQAALRDGLSVLARGGGGREELMRRLAELASAPSSVALDAILVRIGEALVELDVAEDAVADLMARAADRFATIASPERDQPGPPAIAPQSPPGSSASDEAAAGPQTIRVSVDALEHLMTVASELVLIRNQLIQTLRLDPESPFAAPLHRLNQVTSELQEGVMTTRMQPVGGAWSKLPRLVRDLANALGKQIDLATCGEETELDRQVLELIKDPLTHMVRNAADHGLETPAERVAVGKAPAGRIALAARHEGGAIVIEVSDDGRGLSPAKIGQKAISSGLASAAQIEAMCDAEICRFIFAPGFSTASSVTSVSGRGVGMDVVRTNIEKIGGAIELSSSEGKGTRFTIRIPLTLTIVSALIVECCGERFAMPQSSVIELVSASDASGRSIEHIDGAAVLRLRDRLLPLVSLQTLLKLDVERSVRTETCIVVAKVGAFSFGVIVDRVFDTEEIVVKPVASVLRNLKLYSGATILGDGSVILILDFKGIALETGASQAEGAATLEGAATPERLVEDTQAILIFKALGNAPKVAPLASVSRIEEAGFAQFEHVDGRSVIQYRGQLMPIVGADGLPPAPWEGDSQRPLLVFTRGDRSMGLLVDEIVDVVETTVALQLSAVRDGVAGSLIIGGAAAELIDVDHYWRMAMKESVGRGREAVDPSHTAPARRLLVIDRSPFSQLLLEPLLQRAGYSVTVAADAGSALSLHAAGETFDLILADAPAEVEARRDLAAALGHASAWQRTPVLGLGLRSRPEGFDGAEVLEAVTDTLEIRRGAA